MNDVDKKLDRLSCDVKELKTLLVEHVATAKERCLWRDKRCAEHAEKCVDLHETVYGNSTVLGHDVRIDRLEQTSKRIERYGKALWTMAAAVVGLLIQSIASWAGLGN